MNTTQINFYAYKIIGRKFYWGTYSSHHPALRKIFINSPHFAVILNTDNAFYPGEHWIAIYVNKVNKNKTYVFDSYGYSPYFHHPDWYYLLKRFNSTKLWYNKKREQYSKNKCGLHCLYFLFHTIYTNFTPEKNNIYHVW